ncbi:MAG: hypothetical protein ABI388_01410 [Bacteroidia bacterium]
MSKQIISKSADRRRAPDLLTEQFIKDYRASLIDFPENKKVDLLEHILTCFDLAERFWENQTDENWKTLADLDTAFLKKHGKRLKTYRQKNMYTYYGDRHLLIEKGVYTTDEWNELSREKQMFSPSEYANFFKECRRVLYLEREFLLLEQIPEDEIEEKNTKENLSGASKSTKGKLKREAQDRRTYLSQEQTVVLMHYLQKERLFLNDEYLKKTEFGIAIETLTGYSQNTLRQDLGKYENYQSKENLLKIDSFLTHVKSAIAAAMKQKKVPPAALQEGS